ncbi:MAG: GNAT family N-acetyltransferase [Candidatus Eisenbacteria bacterium]
MTLEPVPGRDWGWRRYRPGDEHALMELFNAEFGLNRSIEHWRWQFADNPYGGPYIILAERLSDGMLVGSHVAMPFPLNVLGLPRVGGHTLDLVVHHDFRRQGIFETTARSCFDWMAGEGVAAVVAFPNASSYPGFVRSLGWHRIVFPHRWDLRVGTRGLSGGSLSRAAGPVLDVPVRAWSRLALYLRDVKRDSTIRVVSSVPATVDDLWERIRSGEVLSLWKDRKYLAWRYDANPDHVFEYVCLEEAGALTALAVVTTLGSRLMVCELLAPVGSPAAARRLVTGITRIAVERGHDGVGFIGHDAGRFAGAFSGFHRRVAHENVFCGRPLTTDPVLAERFALPGNWTLTFGDGDFV